MCGFFRCGGSASRALSSRPDLRKAGQSSPRTATGWPTRATSLAGFEVYVQPFPGPGGKWQISTEGGDQPVWGARREGIVSTAKKIE